MMHTHTKRMHVHFPHRNFDIFKKCIIRACVREIGWHFILIFSEHHSLNRVSLGNVFNFFFSTIMISFQREHSFSAISIRRRYQTNNRTHLVYIQRRLNRHALTSIYGLCMCAVSWNIYTWRYTWDLHKLLWKCRLYLCTIEIYRSGLSFLWAEPSFATVQEAVSVLLLNFWAFGWQCRSVGRLVHHLGPQWTISTSIWRIALTFCSDIHTEKRK